MQENYTVKNVMKTYMDAYGLTQQKFADSITQSLVHTDISRVSVTNWCGGKSSPSTDFLLVCAAVYEDWRRAWAVDCLKAKLPEVFEAGVVTFNLPLAQ
jgi:hypothetical protein